MQIYTPASIAQISNSRSREKNKKRKNRSISSSEILAMMKDVEDRFIQPTPQETLGGKLGITLVDMAKILGAQHSDLRRRVERTDLAYLKLLKYNVQAFTYFNADNRAVDSYVLDVMAAQHVASSYNSLAGWYYRDYLIKCKDALKVSLEDHEKIQIELDEVNKQLEVFNRPKITRKNNIIIRNVVAEKSDLFHDTTYRVEKHTIKQPQKGDSKYDEHYIQKLTKISKGNAKSIQNALIRKQCDLDVLNFKVNQLNEVSNEVDTLINPEDKSQYKELVKKIELERLSS